MFVYLNGNNDLAEGVRRRLEGLASLKVPAGTAVLVRAGVGGEVTDYVLDGEGEGRLLPAPSGPSGVPMDMGDGGTLAGFLASPTMTTTGTATT